MRKFYYLYRRIFVGLCVTAMAGNYAFAQTKYSVYPIPQQITQGDKSLSLTQSVHICVENGVDEATRQRAQSILKAAGYEVTLSSDTVQAQTNLILGIHNSGGIADKYGIRQSADREVFTAGANKFDPHIIYVYDATPSPRILILGANTDCVFYGLASLEQMLEQSPRKELTNASIRDFSFQEIRGFVEGFYGFPWYFQDKISLMRYAMRFKMNCYIYGPKSDPYHLGYWKDNYPTSLTDAQKHRGWLSQDDLRNLSNESKATKVRFVWAAHPALQNGINFQTIAGADQGVVDLMKKFDHLYSLGVRDFGVFVDDISVDNAVRDRVQQKYLMNQLHDKLTQKYNTAGADPADTIRPLHFVPTPYPISWGSAEQRQQYFDEIKQLHPSIRIYHTGWGVWSSIEKNSFITNNAECGRITSMWWNYPCNDDGHNKMKMGPINQLFSVDKTITQAQGVVANPMTQPQCSKVAFFGLADYCWNTPKFDAKKNWEHSFVSLIPDDENLRKALRLFAIHSTENKEPQSLIDLYNNYKASSVENPLVSTRLVKEIDSIRWAYNELQRLKTSDNEDYRLMYRDIRPWLNKLNSMAEVITNTIAGQKETSDPSKRVAYFTRAHEIYRDLETNPDHQLEKLMGYGTGSSIEITTAIPSNVHMKGFTQHVQEKSAKFICSETPLIAVSELFSNRTSMTGCTLVNESGIAAFNATALTLLPKEYIGINLNQLKRIESLVIDDEIAAQVEAQYSANGKEWFGFTSEEKQPYAAYIRLYNGQATQTTLSLDKSRFAVSFAGLPQIVAATQSTSAGIHEGTIEKTYDGDRSTFLWTNNVQSVGDRFTYDLGKPTPIHDVTVTFHANDRPGVAKIQGSLKSALGYTDIGSPMTASTMIQSGDQYTHTAIGDGTPAQFVRLYINEPYAHYWLRFAEIEINKQYVASSNLSQDVDDQGKAIRSLSDRNMMTSYRPSDDSRYLDYYLIRNQRTQTIDIYQNTDVIEGKQAPKVSAYSGRAWVELGNLDQSITTFNVSNLTNLQKIRISWEAGSAPSLYEIIEKGTTNDEDILKVEDLAAQNRVKVYSEKGMISVFADSPIDQIRLFDAFGREIERQTVNDRSARLTPATSQNICILQLRLSDGTVQTVKCVIQK